MPCKKGSKKGIKAGAKSGVGRLMKMSATQKFIASRNTKKVKKPKKGY